MLGHIGGPGDNSGKKKLTETKELVKLLWKFEKVFAVYFWRIFIIALISSINEDFWVNLWIFMDLFQLARWLRNLDQICKE